MEGGSESYRIPHHHGGGKAIESSLSGKIVFLSQIHGQSGTRVATDDFGGIYQKFTSYKTQTNF